MSAVAVDVGARHRGGDVADELMDQIEVFARRQGLEGAATPIVLTCHIHTRNVPSQLMAERAGFEPVGLPTGDYQSWLRVLE